MAAPLRGDPDAASATARRCEAEGAVMGRFLGTAPRGTRPIEPKVKFDALGRPIGPAIAPNLVPPARRVAAGPRFSTWMTRKRLVD